MEDPKTTSSGTDQLVRAFTAMGILMMATVVIGLVVLSAVMIHRAPEENRIRSLREATCAEKGMFLLEDKYHPAVCAFKVDEAGKRID